MYLCGKKLKMKSRYIAIMRKLLSLVIVSVFGFGVLNATDSLSVSQDSLSMSVVPPVLSWGDNSAPLVKQKADYLYIPLVFEEYMSLTNDSVACETDDMTLNVNDGWLKSSIANRNKSKKMRFGAMVDNPQNVQFNANDLPEPPKSYLIKTDPSKRMVTIEERKIEKLAVVETEAVKVKKFIHSFNGSVQFSQSYLSKNWYQGGENNINMLAGFEWNVKLNDNLYKKLLFENNVQYKVAVNSAPQDTVRGYSISQDLFQINTKFGYKAIKKWYYSTNLRFKTQMFNNYKANTYDMTTSFLSPAELNIGVGMTYNTVSKDKKIAFDMSLSPLSVDMNFCRDIKNLDPTSFGIEAGKRFNAEFGSNIEAKIVWKLCREVTWSSRLFAFTNYDNVQGDWENTFDFVINKYLSTRLYAHLRYDNSVAKDKDWKFWQFNEILSFGFNYTFSM